MMVVDPLTGQKAKFNSKNTIIEVFKKELASDDSHHSGWSKLFRVFLVDWLVCVIGVLGTGVIFVVIFNLAH